MPRTAGLPHLNGGDRVLDLIVAKPGRSSVERELARPRGVAYDTVRRAAVLLRERGLIVAVYGRGT